MTTNSCELPKFRALLYTDDSGIYSGWKDFPAKRSTKAAVNEARKRMENWCKKNSEKYYDIEIVWNGTTQEILNQMMYE